MAEIEPCPWCGERTGVVREGSTFRWLVVECGCGVVGPEVRKQTLGDGTPEQWLADGTKRAIDAWNRRAPQQDER